MNHRATIRRAKNRLGSRRRRTTPVRGFTLMEVLMVLIILVVIGSIVSTNVFNAKEKADMNTARAQIASLKGTLNLYKINMNKYPTALTDLIEKPSDATEAEKWGNGYIEEGALPKDPWGNEYEYVSPGKNNPDTYDLWSGGPDAQSGTDDDIGNWTPTT
jgi:general secretion pathway protein G